MLRLFAVLFMLLPAFATAQDNDPDSLFPDYAAYGAYVDRMLTTRQWVPFVQRMGGRDEYSAEDLARIGADFDGLFPAPFTERTLFREVDLGGGIRQEARAFWGGGRYLFFYAILHQRKDALVVLNFSMNTRIEKIMEKF